MNKKDCQSDKSLDLSTILQRIAKGDNQAVNECVDTYGNLVWCIARRFSKTRADAEDAAQEIFIDIWKNAARFDQAKSPEGAFIALIAHRRMIDKLRASKRHPQPSSFEIVLQQQASNAHTKLQMYFDVKPALEALSKLKFNQKQVIAMSIYDGMSHREISETIGMSLGTVKTNIRRGLQKIRNSIDAVTPLSMQH
jgi:RNA polymerase sigma-70 factor (ECF subfamily)